MACGAETKTEAFDFVKSVILVGSLSDGTYTGNAGSDIDLIHIVADEVDYGFEKKQISELIGKVEQATKRDVPIANVVFQPRHLVHPYHYDFELTRENKDLIERPTRADVEMTKRINAEQINAVKDTDWYKNEYVKATFHPSVMK